LLTAAALMNINLSESAYWTISASIQSNLFLLNFNVSKGWAAKKSFVTRQFFQWWVQFTRMERY